MKKILTQFQSLWAIQSNTPIKQILIAILAVLVLPACSVGDGTYRNSRRSGGPRSHLIPMKISIQVGAFSNPHNAVRLERALPSEIDAYYFKHEDGLYKVRFGNFPNRALARQTALNLRSRGIIDDFFIVMPYDYPVSQVGRHGKTFLRRKIVQTAKRLINTPYLWGGTNANSGFDCSGLTLAVYRLNGLNLPRQSRSQFRAGRPISMSRIQKGDLVFFSRNGGRRVTHVGIYIGGNRFIHAASKGRRVKTSALSNHYYSKRFVGARTYL
jgi:hypothetical protein